MYIKFRNMLSKTASIAISIAVLIMFAAMTYEVTGHSSSSTSVSVSGKMIVKPELKPDYIEKVNNSSYYIYFVTPYTQKITLNFTLNSSSDPVYAYDIAPLNRSAYVWENITYINSTGNYIEITNATTTPQTYNVTLLVNRQAVRSMEPGIPYPDTIIFINAAGASTYFVILLMLPPENLAQ